MKTTVKNLFKITLILVVLVSHSARAVVVNRVNGGMNAVYIDMTLPLTSVPLEVIRTYNSITAVNEATAWSGSFG